MRFAERVMSLVVRDPEQRESILGDLREEHEPYGFLRCLVPGASCQGHKNPAHR